MLQRQLKYGLDAPEIVKRLGMYGGFAILAIILIVIFVPSGWVNTIAIIILLFIAASMLIPCLSILAGSLFFKFRERDWLFANLPLQGNEQVLDVGCGRGLLLIAAAKRLTSGKAHGLDLWVQADQANNSKDATLQNAKAEGVIDKIKIHSADMRAMPFQDASMDVIISSWAIHNIYNVQEREQALLEIIRVLKPTGRIAILDIDHAASYKDFFIKHGLVDVQLLGPRRTFGNQTNLVLARKKSQS